MEHPVPDFHDELSYRNAKSPASCGRPGFVFYDLRRSLGAFAIEAGRA
jgi:hypothetical protein